MAKVVAVLLIHNRLVGWSVQAFEFRAGQVIVHLEGGDEVAAERLQGIRIDKLELQWSRSQEKFIPTT